MAMVVAVVVVLVVWGGTVGVSQYGDGVREAMQPPYRGESPYSHQVRSAIPQPRQEILSALYRDTAILRPPYWGTPAALAALAVVAVYVIGVMVMDE